jgi:hypothetical protein
MEIRPYTAVSPFSCNNLISDLRFELITCLSYINNLTSSFLTAQRGANT